MAGLREFSKDDERMYYKTKRFGIFYPRLLKIYNTFQRIRGNYSKEDKFEIACACDPPMFFLKYGILIDHTFGITLSVDEIGADCCIGQNVTIGTNAKHMNIGEYTTGHRPRIGNLVRIYGNTVISGEIKIGDYCIIGANSFIDKDVPSKSIAWGVNQIGIMKNHHIKYLQMLLYNCAIVYKLIPGLTCRSNKLFINEEYLMVRNKLINAIENDTLFNSYLTYPELTSP
jgi:acetyltransferase-like isoleucine patch superfamily enzyme